MLLHFLREMLCCVTWIRDICSQELCQGAICGNGASFSRLPDDIMMDILSRLPVESVIACRLVCPRWFHLCSTPLFAEIHLMRAAPVTFAQDIGLRTYRSERMAMFSIENFGNNTGFKEVCLKNMQILHNKRPQLLASCNGLLLFENFMSIQNFVLCNPITQEEAALGIRGKFCGFFFHQSTKEYKLLLWYSSSNNMIQYYVYSLRTRERRNLGSSSYFPQYLDGPAATVHGALFYIVLHRSKDGYDMPRCSKSIMMFDLDTEDFHVMPHPGPKCSSHFTLMHYHMRLLEMDGRLSFSNVNANEVEIWTLEDLQSWSWVKCHVVDLNRDFNHYRYRCFPGEPTLFLVKVFDIQKGELLLYLPFRGLFWCSPRSKTVRKIKTGSELMAGHCSFYATKYTRSFVSLQQIL